jgi:hypothetical protein
MRLERAKALGYDPSAIPPDPRTVVIVEVRTADFVREHWRVRPDAPLSAAEDRVIDWYAAERLLRRGRFFNIRVGDPENQ